MSNNGQVFSMAYLSSATIPFSEQELEELLKRSRASNSKLGITGMLLFKDGNFMQILEGIEDKVRALYDKIARDRRHGSCKVLFEGHSSEPNFPDWAMGFHNLRSLDAIGTPGFSRFLDSALTVRDFGDDLPRAKQLLMLFREKKL